MNRYSEQLKKQEHKLKVIQSSSGMSGPYAFEAPKGLLSLTQQSYGMLEAMCEHMYNTPKRRWVSCGSSELTLKDEEELAEKHKVKLNREEFLPTTVRTFMKEMPKMQQKLRYYEKVDK